MFSDLSVSNKLNIEHQNENPILKKEGFIKKVLEVTKKIFRAIANFFLFPLRYFGSKTWSIPGVIIRTPFIIFKRIFGYTRGMSLKEEILGKGYQFNKKTISKEETNKLIRSAAIATAVHNYTPKWKAAMDAFGMSVIKPSDLSIDPNRIKLICDVEHNDIRFFDRTSGLKMMAVANDHEVVVTFGALGGPRAEIEDDQERNALEKRIWKKVVWSGLGGIKPKIYEDANNLFTAIKNNPELEGKEIKLAGHCMGGSLASYVGLKHKLKVHSFNTLAFGPGLQATIGEKALSSAEQYLTHLSVENDFFSDCKKLKGLDVFASLLGLKTPGNFGKHYRIPAARDYSAIEKYDKRQDAIHNYFLGSMMEFIGHSNRTLPQDLVDSEDMVAYAS